MVSKQMKYVIKGLWYSRSLEIKKRVEEHRKGLEAMTVGVNLPDDVESEHVDIDGLSGKIFVTPHSRDDRIILFLHGGAYIAGSVETSKYHSVLIARLSKAQLLNINYRLAPEHPFPAALDDAVKAYNWLIEEKKFSPKNIVIVGVSAGGGLAIATLLKLKELKLELPLAAVCISPWTDLTFTGATYNERAKIDPFTSPDNLDFSARLYAGESDPSNPYISPIYGDLKGLPPLFVIAGTAEILYDDSNRLAEQARVAGVEVTLDIWEDMIHAFPVFASVAPESKSAIEKIGNFITNSFE
ncbi:MAG: alpha/beta hydrolase [Candidatus Lokiarchaeota archaeon]|nr:alpha/beta hydrolase [Candidatus Lokiarchaeota archaeon]